VKASIQYQSFSSSKSHQGFHSIAWRTRNLLINPLAEAYFNNSVNDPLHAVMAAEERKMFQYVDASRLANLGFLPFGVWDDNTGSLYCNKYEIMDRLAAGKAAATLLDLKEAKRRIYTNIEIAMIRTIGYSFSLRVLMPRLALLFS
jgi:hypothetical protein